MKTQQKYVRAAVFVCIQFVLLMPVANADWFGYKSYDECFRAERKERMDRWFSPMSARDAAIAADDECHKYRESLNRSADSTKQLSEQEQLERKAREEKMRKFQGTCTWTANRDGYCTNAQYKEAREEKMRSFQGPCTYAAYEAEYCTQEQHRDFKAQQSIEAQQRFESLEDDDIRKELNDIYSR